VLGYELCPVGGCMAAPVAGRLCYDCRQRFRGFDGSFEEFIAIPCVALSRRGEQRLCRVCRTPRHERPTSGRDGLCLSCNTARKVRVQTVELRPLPSQEEIDRVRYLIGRIREAMGELEPGERAELQELLAAERTNRSAILERLPARYELNVMNVGATFDGVAG
jgi:hypothetical protein